MDSQFIIENWRYDPNCNCIDCSNFKIRNHSHNCKCINCLQYKNPLPQILYQYEQHQQLTFNMSTTEAQHTDQNRLEIVPQFSQAHQLMQQQPSNQIVSNQFPPF
ncbi:11234_t:CDS:2 [Cetraspora pellucida]|uniref:11234_t:CDS:1 n=1 Tax=Cetraspora pellucida TaxID=1433469 RepID=A0ACA9K576_9GLOM|nr:11234_t:CDS:2 [Cetraspora pellucida]